MQWHRSKFIIDNDDVIILIDINEHKCMCKNKKKTKLPKIAVQFYNECMILELKIF